MFVYIYILHLFVYIYIYINLSLARSSLKSLAPVHGPDCSGLGQHRGGRPRGSGLMRWGIPFVLTPHPKRGKPRKKRDPSLRKQREGLLLTPF